MASLFRQVSLQLKPQTLVAAIQCVAAETNRLAEQLDHDAVDNAAEVEQLLVTFDLAAADLKQAYELALTQHGGLPAYDYLV